MPSPVLKRFWRDLHGKRHLLNAYGTTESGVVFLALDEDSSYMDANIGKSLPATLTQQYPDFDEDGFYCTGDIVHREGDSHFWDGKAKGGSVIQKSHVNLTLDALQ
ncbi:hypothetical protein MW887_010166 [Aspergillus wentii]|nr:hypothetical protein MW887_010166 [Aspergillus wentii]